MAEKAKASKKDNKNLIIGICAAIVAVVIIVIVVLAVRGGGLGDDYFVSDGTKYVLTIESDDIEDNNEFTPLKTHLVYTYDGDKVTSMKSYYVYADADAAKAAFDAMQEAGGEEAKGMELNGKYIIMTAEEDVYKDLTTSDVKKQIEFIEALKNSDTSSAGDSNESENTEETVEVEE
ncbi:hypothetical protein IJJ02_00700 [Candidatus Saccharibacteria bacterium]|nr:hypothetical protein [Candidatus Saccharibacteria bacterium]